MSQRVKRFWFFQSKYSVEHMRTPKVVAFKVVFIWKSKTVLDSSEWYLEPGRISTMKLLVVNYFYKKAPA